MPLRIGQKHTTPRNARPKRSPARRAITSIVNDRARLVAELTRLRNVRGPSTRPLETAHALLTRSWARANWRAREQLIKAARWLLHLEYRREV